jgi:predicted nucleic acid-binding protein
MTLIDTDILFEYLSGGGTTGATALETGYPLFTKNRAYFQRIPGLPLV